MNEYAFRLAERGFLRRENAIEVAAILQRAI
jgi:hypothetical protein